MVQPAKSIAGSTILLDVSFQLLAHGMRWRYTLHAKGVLRGMFCMQIYCMSNPTL